MTQKNTTAATTAAAANAIAKIDKISEADNSLTFTLSGVNVSIANGLRRIASEIPLIVFRTSPHEANKADFKINTTRMNNELLKQRLSCIPIYADTDFPLDDYVLVLDKQNNSNIIEYVTTADFKLFNVKTNEIDATSLVTKLFPANPITGDYPEIVRLLPRVSENIEGERLSFTCKFDIGVSKENSAFNVTSTCVYANTPDPVKRNAAWAEKKKELATYSKEELAFAEKDWLLLDGKRHFLNDSFDFVIETVGPLTNREIVARSALLMIAKLKKIQDTIQSEPDTIAVSETTIPNSYDITLKGEDYTLGKVLEWMLYSNHYDKTLNYCGFRKPHPHIDESILRIGFKNPTDPVNVASYIVNAAVEASRIYDKIAKTFETAK